MVSGILYKKKNEENNTPAFHTIYNIQYTTYYPPLPASNTIYDMQHTIYAPLPSASHTIYDIQHTIYGSRGVTVMLVLAFMGIFALIVGSITSYVLQQGKYGRALFAREQALHIAEAGLEYYKWWLGHNQNGANLTSPTTANYTVNDPEGGAPLGSAEITATPALQCGAVQWIDLESKGTASSSPNFPRTLLARYMQPSVAEYSNITNSNVWYIASDATVGPVHSNGGIHMDGTYNSNVTSAVSTWNCNADFGCDGNGTNPPGGIKNGVFRGDGSSSGLWKWGPGVSNIDFGVIGTTLANLKTKASNNGGIYHGPAAGSDANQRGYHLIFNVDGTVTIRKVTATTAVPSYSTDLTDSNRVSDPARWDYGWTQTEYSIIQTEVPVDTFPIPSSCSVIFIEDHAWIEGLVKGKVTVAVGTPSDSSSSPSAYLPDNITYEANDGTNGLTVIAEGNILIPLTSPDTMELHGIFIASGHFGRNFYTNDPGYCDYGYCVGSINPSYAQNVLRARLNDIGTIVSKQSFGSQWFDGTTVISGFQTHADFYDRLLAFSPPPFTPTASTTYQLNLWREK